MVNIYSGHNEFLPIFLVLIRIYFIDTGNTDKDDNVLVSSYKMSHLNVEQPNMFQQTYHHHTQPIYDYGPHGHSLSHSPVEETQRLYHHPQGVGPIPGFQLALPFDPKK